VTSIQNTSDRKRVEAITISRQTRSKMPPTGLGAQCGAVIAKRRRSRRPMTPRQFNFMRRFYMRLPPTRQGAPLGSCALLIEPTITRMARSSGPAAPPRHPTAMHKAFIAALKQVKTGKFDADGEELMMTFAALVVAAILVASTLYAIFSRTR
jgi:hypothetical protein